MNYLSSNMPKRCCLFCFLVIDIFCSHLLTSEILILIYLTISCINQQLKQNSLELQIAELKIKQHEEKLAHEQSQMKIYAEQVSQLLATEKNLRLQLTTDGEKFQQFQVCFFLLIFFSICLYITTTTCS